MGRYVDGYNRLADGRRVWLIQADDAAGWNWSSFLPHDASDGPYEWGGPRWIRSVPSRNRIRREFGPGDVVFCYQATPLKAVVGLARVSSHGFSKRGSKRLRDGLLFELDWGCLVEPVSLSQMKADSVLASTEKARVGQGTVFRVSPPECLRLLAKTSPRGLSVSAVESALQIEWPQSDEPTADSIELARRVKGLLSAGGASRPTGQRTPKAVKRDGVVVYERDPQVKAWVLVQASGRCELCTATAPFVNADGEPFLETHHVRMLAQGGSDTPTNTVALCPNCHRHVHIGQDAAQQVARLYRQVERLIRE